ncbi:dCTP deaminase, partial [Mesorhizobium sp. BR1-1-5]|nr:dCTP deaminase [Mesorhizobium sp. BR1-1-5]
MSTTLDLDHAATAPVRRSALEAMWPALTGVYGNPSSAHEAGRAAAALLEDARARVARAIGARAGQVVFTSGGTEADALAVLGTVRARILAGRPAGHVLTTGIEHSAVRQSCDQLARLHGVEVEHLALDRDGLTSADDLAARLEGKSSLGRLGLLTHSTAGVIDPGFSGHVTLELSNVATLPITLWPGMKIGQLCFFRLSSAAQSPYGTGANQNRYQGQRGPTAS